MPYPDSTYEQTWREARADKPFVLEDVNQHTPGPWDCDSESMEIFSVTEAHSCGWIALVSGNDSDGMILPRGMRAANARLIAAAPELLAVVRMAIDYANDTKDRLGGNFDGDDAESYDKLMDAADAAINKAEGRSDVKD